MRPAAAVTDGPRDDVDGDGTDDDSPREDLSMATLFLDVGRRDGVRVSEIARLMRDVGALRRSEVGRIRMRDRHTFVEVPDDKLDELLEKLRGHALHDKALSPERAKAGRA